jgi:predicted dehydrogenase
LRNSGTQSLRAAVIGLGHLGRHHARLLHAIPGVELAAICDLLPAKFDQPECPTDVYRTLDSEEAIRRAEVVVVAVPTGAHFQVAGSALRAGADVLVEKPIAATPAEGEELVRMAREARVTLHVGHSERFNGAYRAAAGRLRDVRFVEGHRLAAFVPRALDVDVILDLMIHDLDLVLASVRRPVVEAVALGIPVASPHVDIANARITFEGGCVANLTASRVSARPTRKLRFFVRDAYWSLDFSEQQADVTRLFPVAGGLPRAERETLRPEGEPLRLELADFVGAARARREGLPFEAQGATGEDGLEALRLAWRLRDAIGAHFSRFGSGGA